MVEAPEGLACRECGFESRSCQVTCLAVSKRECRRVYKANAGSNPVRSNAVTPDKTCRAPFYGECRWNYTLSRSWCGFESRRSQSIETVA